MDTHLCGAHTTSSALLFPLVQLLVLASLNNSVQVRITISYSILNTPKGATDKGQEARLQLALLSQTIGRQIHFVTMLAVLRAIYFVPGPALHPLSPPLMSFCFVNAVDVCAYSLSLPSFIITPWAPVSGVWARFYVYVCVCLSTALRIVLLGIKWRQSLEKSLLLFMVAEILLTNWMRCKSSHKPQTLVWHTGERERKVLHTRHCLFQPQNLCPKRHHFTNTHKHMRHANVCHPLCLWWLINFATTSSLRSATCFSFAPHLFAVSLHTGNVEGNRQILIIFCVK